MKPNGSRDLTFSLLTIEEFFFQNHFHESNPILLFILVQHFQIICNMIIIELYIIDEICKKKTLPQ